MDVRVTEVCGNHRGHPGQSTAQERHPEGNSIVIRLSFLFLRITRSLATSNFKLKETTILHSRSYVTLWSLTLKFFCCTYNTRGSFLNVALRFMVLFFWAFFKAISGRVYLEISFLPVNNRYTFLRCFTLMVPSLRLQHSGQHFKRPIRLLFYS